MGNHLYVLKKKGIMLVQPNGDRQPAYLLQLAVRNALAQDSHEMVDRAIRASHALWTRADELPQRVVQVGHDGIPRPGAPLFPWGASRRAYCFESELVQPMGHLGEREIGGFLFLRAEEKKCQRNSRRAPVTAGLYDKGGMDPLYGGRRGDVRHLPLDTANPRLLKILSLIRLIESKGKRASPADLQYLSSLREKAYQLCTEHAQASGAHR